MSIGAALNGLDPKDVRVELVMQRELPAAPSEWPPYSSFERTSTDPQQDRGRAIQYFSPAGELTSDGLQVFKLDCEPYWCGQLALSVRIVPYHRLLTHPYEMGMMKWV